MLEVTLVEGPLIIHGQFRIVFQEVRETKEGIDCWGGWIGRTRADIEEIFECGFGGVVVVKENDIFG